MKKKQGVVVLQRVAVRVQPFGPDPEKVAAGGKNEKEAEKDYFMCAGLFYLCARVCSMIRNGWFNSETRNTQRDREH